MGGRRIGIRVCLLGSGSGGNCTYIGDEQSGLLIDAGLSAQETVYRLRQTGVDPRSLRGILITHEHRDHVYGVESVALHLGLTVYVNEKTRKSGRGFSRITSIQEFETGLPFEIEDYLIHPIPLSHDAADPVAFAVEIDGLKMACVTDLGTANETLVRGLLGCHLLILEFNHDPRLLQNGPYPIRLKERVSGIHGHLSNQEAGQLLKAVLHPNLRHLFLAHISQTNNLPHLALLAAEESLRLGSENGAEPAIHLTWQNFTSAVANLP
ncbi:MAG TPA: MBL fold metallo-hydrolase [Nitrospiria bacterium]|nr:MBL fold metallo-hydrolase [Nitrospiria bacterium]